MLFVVLALIAVLSAMSLPLRPLHRVPEYPLSEDGYYSLTVSRNVALGKGFTVGDGTPTNGFQPLFAFLCVPIFWATQGDRYSSLRLLLVLHLAFWILTAYFVGLIARDMMFPKPQFGPTWMFWFAFSLYLVNIPAFCRHFNGLETGCVLFLHAATWRYYQLTPFTHLRHYLFLGAILGLAVLARIDSSFLVVIIYLFFLVRSPNDHSLKSFFVASVIPATALLVSLPWWLYNLIWFHSLMPVSGQAFFGTYVSLSRVLLAMTELTKTALPIHPLSFMGSTAVIARIVMFLAMLVLAAVVFRRTPANGREWESSRRTFYFGMCYGLFLVSLMLYYAFFSGTTWFFPRYFAPACLLTTIIVSFIVGRLTRYSAIATCLMILLAAFFAAYIGCIHSDRLRSSPGRSLLYRDQLALVNTYVPESDRIAAYQTGTLGFFRDHVTNLDGKVNQEALHLKAHPDKLRAYVLSRNITWFCDWSYQLLGKDFTRKGWRLVGSKGGFSLFKYVGGNQHKRLVPD